jgi:hypothetical protein
VRKLILALPAAALLLAAGILLSEFERTLSEPAPRSGGTDTSPKVNPTGPGWQETGGGSKSSA